MMRINEKSSGKFQDQELKNFINKKIIIEGGLNFTMPSSPIGELSMSTMNNTTNPFCPQKENGGNRYSKKRRSSQASYE